MKRSDLHFSGIYKFTNKANGKVYVGQAGNIYKRLKSHRRLDASTLFGNALRRYGIDGFDFEVLERVDDLSVINNREQFWMDFYECCNRQKGYNTAPIAGSNRGKKASPRQIEATRARGKAQVGEKNPFYGRVHTEEAKQILSEKAKARPPITGRKNTPEVIERTRLMGKAQVGEKATFYGRKHTEEAKRIMSEKAKGREVSTETRKKIGDATRRTHEQNPELRLIVGQKLRELVRKKINQIDPATALIVRTWDCVQDISQELGLSKYSIGQMCRGPYFHKSSGSWEGKQNKPIGGFFWRYVSEKPGTQTIPEILMETVKPKKIAQIDPETQVVISIWGSASEIQRCLGIGSSRILYTCKGGYYDYQYKKWYKAKDILCGYKWQYVE